MKRWFKRLWKYVISVECLAIVAIIVIIFLIFFPFNSNKIKAEHIVAVESVKDCVTETGQPVQMDECAKSLGYSSQGISTIAQNILIAGETEAEKGWAAILLNNIPEAIIYLNKSQDLNPYDIRLYRDLAFAYLKLNDYENVVQSCNEVLSRNSNDVRCLDMQAISYYMLDNNDEALKNVQRSIDIEPHICRNLNLGLYQGGVGNITEAKRLIDEVIEKDKQIVLRCWSPIRMENVPANLDDYDICFLNKQRGESVCRSFAEEGWRTRDKEGNEIEEGLPEGLPEPVFSM